MNTPTLRYDFQRRMRREQRLADFKALAKLIGRWLAVAIPAWAVLVLLYLAVRAVFG